MQRVIKELQKLRTAPLYSNSQFQTGDYGAVCLVRHLSRGRHVLFTYDLCSIFVSNTKVEVYNLRNGTEYVSFKVPYNCEDRQEFFQLSTINDFHNMTYDDLIELKDLCDFMVKRDINERK